MWDLCKVLFYYVCLFYFSIIISTKNANSLLETVDKHIHHLHSFFSGLLSNIDNQKQVCSIRRKEMERDGYDTSELDKMYYYYISYLLSVDLKNLLNSQFR